MRLHRTATEPVWRERITRAMPFRSPFSTSKIWLFFHVPGSLAIALQKRTEFDRKKTTKNNEARSRREYYFRVRRAFVLVPYLFDVHDFIVCAAQFFVRRLFFPFVSRKLLSGFSPKRGANVLTCSKFCLSLFSHSRCQSRSTLHWLFFHSL